MKSAARIVIDERIHPGKAVIRGTRLPVEIILGSLEAGMGWEEIMKEYRIGREDIVAVLEYARAEGLVSLSLPVCDWEDMEKEIGR